MLIVYLSRSGSGGRDAAVDRMGVWAGGPWTWSFPPTAAPPAAPHYWQRRTTARPRPSRRHASLTTMIAARTELNSQRSVVSPHLRWDWVGERMEWLRLGARGSGGLWLGVVVV